MDKTKVTKSSVHYYPTKIQNSVLFGS